MFENLQERLGRVLTKLRGQGRLTEDNIKDTLREVRMALLEADVNFKVVKDFVDRVREKCLGQDVLKSLTPGQQVVKIVHAELVELLGGETKPLDLRGRPSVVMMVGLQGSGKTTSAAKLALHFRRTMKMKPYLVPADVYRPAQAGPHPGIVLNHGVAAGGRHPAFEHQLHHRQRRAGLPGGRLP